MERDLVARRWDDLHAAVGPLCCSRPTLQSSQAEAEVHPEVETHQAELCSEEGVQGGGGEGHRAGPDPDPPLHLLHPRLPQLQLSGKRYLTWTSLSSISNHQRSH